MKDLLLIITMGNENQEMARFSLTGALRQAKSGRYNDVKVLFYGPSEKFIANTDESTESTLKELISLKTVDSACIAIAKFYNVDKKLNDMGIELAPFGERLASYIEKGYQVVTF